MYKYFLQSKTLQWVYKGIYKYTDIFTLCTQKLPKINTIFLKTRKILIKLTNGMYKK
jgi:hypothetical protein